MSYPTPGQPGGDQYPPGTPAQPYPAPTQPGYPAQPIGQPFPGQPGQPGQPYPGQPGQPYPGQFPPPPARSRGPLVAWIAGGVVVVVAVVLVIVFTVGGGGGGCSSLNSKAQTLATKMESDETSADSGALADDFSQFQSILNDAAGDESGQTATDLRKLADDFGALSNTLKSGDLSSLSGSALDSLQALEADGEAVDKDCGFDTSFGG